MPVVVDHEVMARRGNNIKFIPYIAICCIFWMPIKFPGILRAPH